METTFLFPFLLMLIIILTIFFSFISSQPIDLTSDQDALLAFKKSITNGALTNNWLSNTSVCNWAGVMCGSKHRRVISLNLTGFGLEGNLSPHLGNLSFLRSLDISSNSFTGVLPTELSKLQRLQEINAASNNLSGEIPRGILTNMSVLVEIDRRNNKLSGELPSDVCSNTPKLKRLLLDENQIDGNIPKNIYKCREMEELRLSKNQFNGTYQRLKLGI